ncbi:cytochrome P450 716B1-like protein [Tanacetum coccineum]
MRLSSRGSTSVAACIKLCLVCPSCLLGAAYVCDIRTSYVSRQCTGSDGDGAAPCLLRRLATLDWRYYSLVIASGPEVAFVTLAIPVDRSNIRNLVAPPPNNTYVPFGASPTMCPGIELVKMETSAMIHFLTGIIIIALLLVNEFVNAKNPTNPSDFSISSSIGNTDSDASLSPPSKEGCMA